MKMLTLKLTPKKIFGIILLLVGLIVISVTFVANRTGEVQSVSASISAKTDGERRAYLKNTALNLQKNARKKKSPFLKNGMMYIMIITKFKKTKDLT